MRCQLENVLVDCLRDTLHIMLCSGSCDTVRTAERFLKQCPLYSLFKAKSPQTMEELFGQIQSWHVVIIDEQCQFAPDFKAIVQRYPGWVPVITLTNSWSIRTISGHCPPAGTTPFKTEEAAGSAHTGGGLDIDVIDERPVAACSIANPAFLMHTTQEWAIRRKLLSKIVDGLAAEAMSLLFKKNPLSVDEWSSMMGVKPRRFQREFKMFTDLSPKKILALYHAYRIAFNVVDNHTNREKGIVSAYLVDDRSKERVMEYVLTHRSALLTVAS